MKFISKFVSKMPTVLRISGYVFSFYSNEGNELPHVHVGKADAEGKIWLEPEIEIEFFIGFNQKEKKRIMEIVKEHSENFIQQWYEYFKK